MTNIIVTTIPISQEKHSMKTSYDHVISAAKIAVRGGPNSLYIDPVIAKRYADDFCDHGINTEMLTTDLCCAIDYLDYRIGCINDELKKQYDENKRLEDRIKSQENNLRVLKQEIDAIRKME